MKKTAPSPCARKGPFLLSSALLLTLCLSFTSAGAGTPYFGLPHTALGTAVLTPDGTGSLLVDNLGSSGQDGVRIDLNGSQGVWIHAIPDGGAATGGMNVVCSGELSSAPGTTQTALSYSLEPGPGGGWDIRVTPETSPTCAVVEGYLDGAVVFSTMHSPPPAPGTVVFSCQDPDTKGKIKVSNLGSSGCDGFSIELDWTAPNQVTILGAGGPVLADAVLYHCDNEMDPFLEAHQLEVTSTGVPSVTIPAEGVVMFDRVHEAVGLATLEPMGGKLKISNLGSSGCDGFSVDLGDDDQDSETVRWSPLVSTDPTGDEFETAFSVSLDGLPPGLPVLLSQTPPPGPGRGTSREVRADFSAMGATGLTLEIYDNGLLVTSIPGISEPLVATLPNGELPVEAGNSSSGHYYYWRVTPNATILSGGGLHVGDELRFVPEGVTATTVETTRLEVTALNILEIELISPVTPVSVPEIGAGAQAGLSLFISPNPARAGAASTIRFSRPIEGPTNLRVFDVAGRLVATLREHQVDPGTTEISWSGVDEQGRRLGAGVYFVRLDTQRSQAVSKVTLLR